MHARMHLTVSMSSHTIITSNVLLVNLSKPSTTWQAWQPEVPAVCTVGFGWPFILGIHPVLNILHVCLIFTCRYMAIAIMIGWHVASW